MAVIYGKKLNIMLNKSKQVNLLAALRTNLQDVFPVAYCSTDAQSTSNKLSRAMKSYLEKVSSYDKFMKEQLQEYNKGKQFLAGMMGKTKEMTQKDIDEAIEYLFPSALFVPKARPMMKPPEEIYKKQKHAEFDYSGRPFHFLFYTNKMNYSQCLHDAASKLEELNLLLCKKEPLPKPLLLLGGRWMKKDELEEKFLEKLYEVEYEKFIEVFKNLSNHPYASLAEEYIKEFWFYENASLDIDIPKPTVTEEGFETVVIDGVRKKRAFANVKVSCPGSGQILINNLGIDYFYHLQCREQVIFPLLLTDMLGKVDIEATVNGGGDSSQAAAIRLGISKALQAFVPKEILYQMKAAGLLQRDIRIRERKKPGQEGARRRYTWLKR